MKQNIKVHITKGYDMNFKMNDDDALVNDPNVYRRLIGNVLYLSVTRSNTVYYVQHLSHFMQSPKQSNLDALYRVMKYVKKQTVFFVLYYISILILMYLFFVILTGLTLSKLEDLLHLIEYVLVNQWFLERLKNNQLLLGLL